MSTQMAKSLMLFTAAFAACLSLAAADWSQGTATFYGGPDGSGTMGGACGYENLYNAGYGVNNAALSPVLFNDGASCGQCYIVICDASRPGGQYCKPGTWITVTATNLCPSNNALPNGGWCGPGRPHFDMSQPAWENIGVYSGGIIPVQYQQVKCWRNGGVRFSMAGNYYFLLVNIQNLAGSGSVAAAWIKGDKTGWIQMSRNWGANWQALAGLVGQGLSFAVTSTGGQYIQFLNVVPGWWQFGMTFNTNQNFNY
nr:expansin 79 [Saccharum hybrid cultivar]